MSVASLVLASPYYEDVVRGFHQCQSILCQKLLEQNVDKLMCCLYYTNTLTINNVR